MTEIAPEQWAYLAGIVDGEGSFVPRKRERSVRLQIAMVDEAMLRGLRDEFDAGSVSRSHTYKTSRGIARTVYCWDVSARRDLSRIVDGMLPFLRVKRTQARRVGDFMRMLPFTPPASVARQEAWEAIRQLNGTFGRS